MVIILLVVLFILVISWMLLTPIQLNIDSTKSTYLLVWKGIASARLIPSPNDIHLRFKVFFWKKDYYPLKEKASILSKKDKPEQSKQQKKKKSISLRKASKKAKRILSTFQVKILRLKLDTDDYVVNSYLFPIFYFLSKKMCTYLSIMKGKRR
jgi:hypothetical protein